VIDYSELGDVLSEECIYICDEFHSRV
jgi:hypothetical protein